MKTHGRFFTIILALALTLSFMAALPSPSAAQEASRENVLEIIKNPMADSPLLVKMSHWRDSRPGQRYAFLIGFMSMLDLENEWQAANEKPLSFKQSLVPSWVKAMKAKSLQDIYNGLNDFVEKNPDQLDRPVTEIMWFTFVQPTITEKLEQRKKK